MKKKFRWYLSRNDNDEVISVKGILDVNIRDCYHEYFVI